MQGSFVEGWYDDAKSKSVIVQVENCGFFWVAKVYNRETKEHLDTFTPSQLWGRLQPLGYHEAKAAESVERNLYPGQQKRRGPVPYWARNTVR